MGLLQFIFIVAFCLTFYTRYIWKYDFALIFISTIIFGHRHGFISASTVTSSFVYVVVALIVCIILRCLVAGKKSTVIAFHIAAAVISWNIVLFLANDTIPEILHSSNMRASNEGIIGLSILIHYGPFILFTILGFMKYDYWYTHSQLMRTRTKIDAYDMDIKDTSLKINELRQLIS